MSTSIVKSGAREPSNLDSVVVCRRSVDGFKNPNTSLGEAREAAVGTLRQLAEAQIDVGAGDVRSVVRGTLLAYLSSIGRPLDTAAEAEVDELAERSIQELIGP